MVINSHHQKQSDYYMMRRGMLVLKEKVEMGHCKYHFNWIVESCEESKQQTKNNNVRTISLKVTQR